MKYRFVILLRSIFRNAVYRTSTSRSRRFASMYFGAPCVSLCFDLSIICGLRIRINCKIYICTCLCTCLAGNFRGSCRFFVQLGEVVITCNFSVPVKCCCSGAHNETGLVPDRSWCFGRSGSRVDVIHLSRRRYSPLI